MYYAMAHRARSGKPWELIAWTLKRSAAERSTAQTKAQEKALGRARTQVRVFTECQWNAMQSGSAEPKEKEE